MEDFPAYINILTYAFIVMYMLSVPLETTRGDIIKTLGHLPIASNYFSGTDVSTPMLAFSGLMIPMNLIFALAVAWASRDRTETASAVDIA